MNEQQIRQWKESRDIARAIQDPESRRVALEKVYDQRDEMQMECIAHQAERIKSCLRNHEKVDSDITEIRKDISAMKTEIKPLKETDEEFRRYKERGKGAVWGVRLSIAVIGIVGFETFKHIVEAVLKLYN